MENLTNISKPQVTYLESQNPQIKSFIYSISTG